MLSAEGSSNAWPVLAADPKGNVALVWQSFRSNQSVVLLRTRDGRRWSAELRLNEGSGNAWAGPARLEGRPDRVARTNRNRRLCVERPGERL